jgi:pilus assembly protein Flp/PilA
MKFFRKREEGQGLVEYALLLVLVAVVVIGALMLLGPQINAIFSRVVGALGGGPGVIVSHTVLSYVEETPGKFKLSVQVKVSQSTQITLTAGGKSSSVACNATCTPSVSGIAGGGGTYTVSAQAGGSVSGAYP